MSSEKIVTLFDTLEHAKAAERNLLKAGFNEDDMSIIESQHIKDYEANNKDVSIWKRLFGNDVDDEYAAIYSDAVRTNGAVLSMKVKDEDEQATALAILNRHQVVDVSQRQLQQTPPAGDTTLAPTEKRDTLTSGDKKVDTTSGVAKTDRPWLTGNETKDEILRLAKEELEIGKRLVKEGTTRIRRYVTEENVSRTINLREQHAEILRQAVNKPVTDKDVDWSDKEIVIDEMAEKPVVSKSVHITEEVAVKKANTDREEKVTDTVRQQHVDIERNDTKEKKNDLPKP
ncbi:YsnF/AvaK domain-containing protein [Enterobacteriaceae bacterium YMB-R22]|jgi:uncharacterized protein (TIGR02271 family)|uniref:YsnF/AvaK domain-containing protein n=1 Tax=Tenebrionicola larvae TaxID=2815733 RepID=UPI0020134B51|nr:YsnF/AvaK domain-containing protein [Tenebrionicola larvae]MBV4414189.1 YsnF/AvaK domain-containing protein [Tenebrionicola larvae]